jgi:hypothetical protein
MTDTPAEVVESIDPPRRSRHWRRMAVLLAIMLLLFGVPWWTLLAPGAAWPAVVFVVGTLLFVAAFVALPLLMMLGHGRRHLDRAASVGDALLGAAWVLFVWSVLGQGLGLALHIAGVEDPARSRLVAVAVLAAVVVLLVWGYAEAMRVPRVRKLDVAIARLGSGLDGLRVALITDTHYGPIDRARWSAAVVARVNELDADVVCHVGDIADGTVDVREEQARPLASVAITSTSARRKDGSTTWRASAGPRYIIGTSPSNAMVTGSSSRGWMTPLPRRRVSADTARISSPPSREPTRHCRSFCSRINPNRSRTQCGPASISRSRVTLTAARSGRSIFSSDWINQ